MIENLLSIYKFTSDMKIFVSFYLYVNQISLSLWLESNIIQPCVALRFNSS